MMLRRDILKLTGCACVAGCYTLECFSGNSHKTIGGCTSIQIDIASNNVFGVRSFGDGSRVLVTKESSSGDTTLDKQLYLLASDLRDRFSLKPKAPGIILFSGGGGVEAFATSRSLKVSVQATDGTVFISTDFLNDVVSRGGSAAASIAGIIAHEFAHIFQFRQSRLAAMNEPEKPIEVKNIELHADFLAGWYLGKAGYIQIEELNVFGHTLFKMGSFDFSNPTHHGTPAQRFSCMVKGFFLARGGTGLSESSIIGENFVSEITWTT